MISSQDPAIDEISEQLASTCMNQPPRNEYLGLPYELMLQWCEEHGIRETTSWERLPLLAPESRKAILEGRKASHGIKTILSGPFVTVLEDTLFYSTRPRLKKLEEISLIEAYRSQITTLSFCGLQFAPEGDVSRCNKGRTPEECANWAKEWDECTQRGRDQEEFRSSGEYIRALSQILTRFPKLKHIRSWPVHPERSEGYWIDTRKLGDGPNRRFRWERTDAHLYKNAADTGYREQDRYKQGDDLKLLFAALFIAKIRLKTFTTPHLANTARWVAISDKNLRNIHCGLCAAVFSELEELRINIHNASSFSDADEIGIWRVLSAAPNLKLLDLTFTAISESHSIYFTGLVKIHMPKLEELRLNFDHSTTLKPDEFLGIFRPDISRLLGLRRLCLGYMSINAGTWEHVLTELGTRLDLESLWLISPRFDDVVLPHHYVAYSNWEYKRFDAGDRPAFYEAARSVRVIDDWEPFETAQLVA
ncbi:uncharacterized protein BDZ99DRAFT_502413 [Mytilinidion resinicola]|uniref:RNI-like protein n=1 Tax=Mytilinidion resinicola TaxID=574789 RepID=A0A6A6Y8S0_9PEZI|nr:uncharacterized protein BDZ99DRAFT_502413 [Mytilinidion resinicola]KAF2804525.1 hypothetical protein BDZ99DRAFT_502413 [Mytilinidion resinicola]